MTKSSKILIKQETSARLVYFREKIMNLSQVAFAKAIGISVRTLQTYEYGQSEVSTDFCSRAYMSMKLNMIWLVTGQGNPLVDEPANRPLVQIATEAVDSVISDTGGAVDRLVRSRLYQAVYDDLLKKNGKIEDVPVSAFVGLVAR